MYKCLLCHRPLHIRDVSVALQSSSKKRKKHKNNTPPICCDICGSRIAEKVIQNEKPRTVNAD